MEEEENVLHDSPKEFISALASVGGGCDAQSILPLENGGYLCHCTCGEWDVTALSQEEGLGLAQKHTKESIGF
jgi:hypothetical protein